MYLSFKNLGQPYVPKHYPITNFLTNTLELLYKIIKIFIKVDNKVYFACLKRSLNSIRAKTLVGVPY